MSQSIAPSTQNFSAIQHKMTVKATSLTDHNRSSRNKDCVAIFLRMKIVVNISMASGTLSVVNRQCGVIVRVVILDDYRIMKRADWGSRSWRFRIKRGMRNDRRRNGWSLRSLKRRRKRRWVGWYDWWRKTHPLMMAVIPFLSQADDWL